MFQREEKRWEKFLVRGSAEGCLLVWKVPDTKECNALQVKAETADKPPALEPIQDRSLAHCWATTRPQPVGVLDQMDNNMSENAELAGEVVEAPPRSLHQHHRLVVVLGLHHRSRPVDCVLARVVVAVSL